MKDGNQRWEMFNWVPYAHVIFEIVLQLTFLRSLQARYKCQLDPTVDEVKKLCTTCRRYAKSERVLFHYNGHGVPKPTANGEIWVFNKVNVCIFLVLDARQLLYKSDIVLFILAIQAQLKKSGRAWLPKLPVNLLICLNLCSYTLKSS